MEESSILTLAKSHNWKGEADNPYRHFGLS